MSIYMTIKLKKEMADSLKGEIQNIVKNRHPDFKYENLSYSEIIYWLMERYRQ